MDKALVEMINSTILEKGPGVHWDDIQGLSEVKETLMENIVYPQLNPEIFSGIRAPDSGILFYGPPGNGKTLLAKAVATECKCTFYSVSASALMSKWLGESEKLMKTLFALARSKAPSVIFFDEIDSMLSKRKSEGENEGARRLKTEFLVQVDGCGAGSVENAPQVLVIGATNRPFDLDEAALRRLTKRIFITLPDAEARLGSILKLVEKVGSQLNSNEKQMLCALTENYSFADLKAIVKDAAMGPVRDLHKNGSSIAKLDKDSLRSVNFQDF